MSLRLDPPVALGGHAVAVLCDCEAEGWPMGHGARFHARKIPVAVLIRTGEVLQAFGLNGEPLDLDALEDFFPGLRAALTPGPDEDRP